MANKRLTHTFVSTIADSPNTLLVRPQSGWNAEHNFTLGYRTVTGTLDTLTSSDVWSGIVYTNSGSVAVSMDSTTLSAGWVSMLKNNGGGTVTLVPASGLINGASSSSLPTTAGMFVWCDGINYYAFVGQDFSVSPPPVGPVQYVTSGLTVNVNTTTGLLLLNKATTTTVNLPAVSTRPGQPLEVSCWSGLEGDVTLVPSGAETIMGLSTWVISSLGSTGGGGSARLIPVTNVSGWLIR